MNIVIDNKLKLIPVRVSDAKELFSLTEENRAYLDKWLPWVKKTNSVSDSKDFIRNSIKKSKDKNGFDCLIIYNNKIAGVIGLVEINKARNVTEIGYWLGEKYTGKGIMTKSCKVLTDHCFKELKLNRVIIKCEISNKASQHIPERLGYFKQGILKRDGYYNERYADHVQYSMFKREWIKGGESRGIGTQ